MRFYLKTENGAHRLFSVEDDCGNPVYEVTGRVSSFSHRFVLSDCERNAVGKVSGVRLSSASQYSVTAGRERIRVSLNVSSARRPMRIIGRRWRFRGSLLTRSFDFVDPRQRTVMTHGRCWERGGDCYAVEIADPENVPLCLCLAVIADCSVQGGCAVPVPAGG